MTAFVATNVATGTVEKPKYLPTGLFAMVYSIALPNTLAAADTITGPSIPAGAFLHDIVIDSDQLDSNGSATLAFNIGITGTLTKFGSAVAIGRVAAGTRTPSAVGGVLGYSPAANTPVVLTVSTAAATKVAGTLRISVICTGSP